MAIFWTPPLICAYLRSIFVYMLFSGFGLVFISFLHFRALLRDFVRSCFFKNFLFFCGRFFMRIYWYVDLRSNVTTGSADNQLELWA